MKLPNSLSVSYSLPKCSTNLYTSAATTNTHEFPDIPFFPLRAFIRNNYAQEFYYLGKCKLQDFVSRHFVFAVNYVHDKNAPYGSKVPTSWNVSWYALHATEQQT